MMGDFRLEHFEKREAKGVHPAKAGGQSQTADPGI